MGGTQEGGVVDYGAGHEGHPSCAPKSQPMSVLRHGLVARDSVAKYIIHRAPFQHVAMQGGLRNSEIHVQRLTAGRGIQIEHAMQIRPRARVSVVGLAWLQRLLAPGVTY